MIFDYICILDSMSLRHALLIISDELLIFDSKVMERTKCFSSASSTIPYLSNTYLKYGLLIIYYTT
jgi:hypothetical protein